MYMISTYVDVMCVVLVYVINVCDNDGSLTSGYVFAQKLASTSYYQLGMCRDPSGNK